ncbi:hypothetical protein ACVMYR_03435 [Micromonospora sp. PTRAS2]
MIRLVESLGDRMLSLVVPKATATAAACQGSAWWGSYCYCQSYRPYYLRCTCVNGVPSCTCQPRAGIGTC